MYELDRMGAHGGASRAQKGKLRHALDGRQPIVVSNRQPYRHEYGEDGDGIVVDRPTGGLTAGLDPVLQRTGGTWIAWGDGEADRDVVDAEDCVAVPPDDAQYRLRRVWLSPEQVRGYYYGFSNRVLWPICHSALTTIDPEPSFWTRYRNVNEWFAEAVVAHASERPFVWFQDYHLALAPQMARPRLPAGATLAHFWHIPWPSWDVFRACPHGRSIIRGLLGNDFLGFHVDRYRTNFLRCVDVAVDDATVDWQASEVTLGGHVTRVEAIPMGVPFDQIQRLATSAEADAYRTSFDRDHGVPDGARIAVGVDRLDYTKGIVPRLRALERFWETYPRWRGALTYVQNASESRSQIPAYQRVRERVEETVERINRRFGTDEWQPIVYGTESLSREELYGLYRRADAALVSPIRDGMNLVAQEYVAAQVNGDGVLVLSDQTGAHDEIGEHAFTVSPYDTATFAETIAEALTTHRRERGRRMETLRRWVADNDLDAWLHRNLELAVQTPRPFDRRMQFETP